MAVLVSGAVRNEALLRISFTDFQVRTFDGKQSKEWIEKNGDKVWIMQRHSSLKPHPFVLELKNLLEAHPSEKKMSSQLVRFKAEFFSEGIVYFMDASGVVEKERSEKTYTLTPKEMSMLEQKLRSFIGVVDQEASSRLGEFRQD
jgi:hypothetical protein